MAAANLRCGPPESRCCGADSDCALRATPRPERATLRRTQCEQMSSELPLKADIAHYGRHVSKVPTHKVAALQPAARGQEPRGRKPAERKALAGLRAPS